MLCDSKKQFVELTLIYLKKNAKILLRQLSEKSEKSVSLIFFVEIITNICLYDNSSNSRFVVVSMRRRIILRNLDFLIRMCTFAKELNQTKKWRKILFVCLLWFAWCFAFHAKDIVGYLVPMTSMLIGNFRMRWSLMVWGSLISSLPVRKSMDVRTL